MRMISEAISIFASLGIPGLFCALILRRVNGRLDEKEERDEERAKAQQEESVLVMENLQAIGHLAEATAIAYRDGKVNGVMTTALDYYARARDKTNDYLLRQNAAANHG